MASGELVHTSPGKIKGLQSGGFCTGAESHIYTGYVWIFLPCCDRIYKWWFRLGPRRALALLACAPHPLLRVRMRLPYRLCRCTQANVTELVEPSLLRIWTHSRVSLELISSGL
ncbi:hypothetical protein ACJJTC_008038 [Scirpophaga incertulas]